MTSLPRVFVGTMFSIENQFKDCINVIQSQKEIHVTHEIISGLREHDAHVKLYESWEKMKDQYDAFIKVDADMILKDDLVLHRMTEEINRSVKDGYTSIQCPLYDYYIEDMIFGLNCYSTKVIFHTPSSKLFCDRSTSNNFTKVIRSSADSHFDLFPAGSHCDNPSEKQAFMWGYHRGAKSNTSIYHQLKDSYDKNPTWEKKIALAGFKSGESRRNVELSYEDREFDKIFEHAKAELLLVKS